MDIFKQIKFLRLLVFILVLLNISTLSVLWYSGFSKKDGQRFRPPVSEEKQVKRLLKENLGFNDEQVEKYLKLRKEHHKKALVIESEIKRLKKEMFDSLLTDNGAKEIPESILQEILKKQATLERLTFYHFLDLKNLCGADQKEKLKILMSEVFRQKEPPLKERDRLPPHSVDMPLPPRGE
ncbi:hypothetical protein DSN97_02010 [Deferribacteraceae bacterium V6Fe1]|nr:hypothetical protein DSN97_02010 [Deferribacteraceae bacterium V6Fe1]